MSSYPINLGVRFLLELAALASGASLRLGPSHKDAWPGVNFELRPGPSADAYLAAQNTMARAQELSRSRRRKK